MCEESALSPVVAKIASLPSLAARRRAWSAARRSSQMMRGPQRPAAAVDRHDAVHLGGQAQVADLGRGDARGGDHLPDRRGQPVPPLRRVLLGPAAGRMAHRAAVAGRGDLAAVGIDQQGLDALRADVRADQVAHVEVPRMSFAGKAPAGATACRSSRQRQDLQPFVDEPPCGLVLLWLGSLEVEREPDAAEHDHEVDRAQPVRVAVPGAEEARGSRTAGTPRSPG